MRRRPNPSEQGLNPDWVAMRDLRDDWEVRFAALPADPFAAMVTRYADESIRHADPLDRQNWFLGMRLRHITTRISVREANNPTTGRQPQ